MGTNNIVFLELLEWFDDTGEKLVHRLPEKGSADIKYGEARLRCFSITAGLWGHSARAATR